MSIDAVFGFLFQSTGAKETKKSLSDINKEMKALEERNGSLTKEELKQYEALKKQKQATDQLKQSNNDLAKSVAGMISSYVGFKKILSEITGFAKGGEDLALMAQQAGVSAEMLEKYGIALQNYGGSLSSASATLSSLGQQLNDLKFGKGGAIQEAAIRYGISVSGSNGGIATPEEMLFNIAKRMESLGTQQQLDLGKNLGLDPATLSMVQGGVKGLREELEKASKLTIYSKEDIETSRKFQQSLRSLTQAIDKVWAVVGRALLPVLTSVADVVTKIFNYLAEHKGFVLGFLSAIAVALGIIAVQSIIATAPFWLMVLAIAAVGAAIGLLVDDFVTFWEGGDSCIGWIIDRFADLWLAIFELGDKIGAFFKKVWQGVADTFTGIWDGIVARITAAFDWIVEKWRKVKSWIPFMGDDEANIVETGHAALESTNNPLSTMSTSNFNTSTNNSSVKIDQVVVNTRATDARGIASSIGGELDGELNNVLYQNTSGAVA